MTLLIIGGLLAVAILAILGAVFLGVSEQRTEKARTNGSMSLSSSSSIPLVEQPSTVNRAAERTAPTRQNPPPTAERTLRSARGSQQQDALNGQFHELTAELRTLYQHAWELERRLRSLTEIAERLEETQSNQVGTEVETHS